MHVFEPIAWPSPTVALDGQASSILLVAVYLDPHSKTFYFIRDARKREKRLERAARKVEGLVELPVHDRPRPRRHGAFQESARYARHAEQLFGAEAFSASTLPSGGDDHCAELERCGRKPATAVFLHRSDSFPPPPKILFDHLLWRKQREFKCQPSRPARRYLSLITLASVLWKESFPRAAG